MGSEASRHSKANFLSVDGKLQYLFPFFADTAILETRAFVEIFPTIEFRKFQSFRYSRPSKDISDHRKIFPTIALWYCRPLKIFPSVDGKKICGDARGTQCCYFPFLLLSFLLRYMMCKLKTKHC